MKRTFEGAQEARSLVHEYPGGVPPALLSRAICQGKVELVARVSAVLVAGRRSTYLPYYVLALLISGERQDIQLARELLGEKGVAVEDRDAYLQAAEWIRRFDLEPEVDTPIVDLGRRLDLLAGCAASLKRSLGKVGRSEEFEAAVKGAVEQGLPVPVAASMRSLHWISLGDTGRAFQEIEEHLRQLPDNPYVRMAAHRVFQCFPEDQGGEVLLYDGEGGCRAFGLRWVNCESALFKEYKGHGFGERREDPEQDALTRRFAPLFLLSRNSVAELVRSRGARVA